MTSARVMLSFVAGTSRFNYRTAAIAIRDGHVLTCREDDDHYVMLPGGRVEMGEASRAALAREIAEELQSAAEIGRLIYTVENFFEHGQQSVHELAAYYLVDLPAAFPFRHGGVVLETRDEGHDLRFEWVRIEGNDLRDKNLLPPWMIGKLRDLPQTTEHLVLHEER